METDTADLAVLRQKTHVLLEKLKLNQNRVKEALDDTINASKMLLVEGRRRGKARKKLSHTKSESKEPSFSNRKENTKSSTSSKIHSQHQHHHITKSANYPTSDTSERVHQRKKLEGQDYEQERPPQRVPVSVVKDTFAETDKKIVYYEGCPGTPKSDNVSSTENPIIANGHAGTPPNCKETLSLISDRNRTSTPKQQASVSKTDTPRSILKNRKMIDDHVKVDSKYSHPDIVGHNPKRIQLNFSYCDDPLKTPQGVNPSPASSGSKSPYVMNLDGSYIEEYLEDEPLGDKREITRSRDETSSLKVLNLMWLLKIIL